MDPASAAVLGDQRCGVERRTLSASTRTGVSAPHWSTSWTGSRMPLERPWAAPNSALKFPSPPELAWNRTYIHCAHPYARPARGWAACTRIGSKYRNRCTAGRNGVQSRTSDTARSVRRSTSAKRRIVRNGKPCACPASAARAGRRSLSWPAFRWIAFAVLRPGRGLDTRVGDTSVPTQTAPWCKRILSRFARNSTSPPEMLGYQCRRGRPRPCGPTWDSHLVRTP